MQQSANIGGPRRVLAKTPTGIQGLDEFTNGGLPKGRPTLICGGAGSGKTLLATSFLVNGAEQFGEAGVLMTFEGATHALHGRPARGRPGSTVSRRTPAQKGATHALHGRPARGRPGSTVSRRTPAQKENGDEIASDVASLGFDLPALVEAGKLFVNYVRIERSEIEETGEYDLEGLFVRLDHAIRATGAKRIVLDTIDSLFSGLGNANILRAELRRLFRRLKDKGLTGVYTAAAGGEVSRLASRHQRVYVSHRPPASRPRRTSPRKPKPASHRSWIPGS